jgi:hypothetical protein
VISTEEEKQVTTPTLKKHSQAWEETRTQKQFTEGKAVREALSVRGQEKEESNSHWGQ